MCVLENATQAPRVHSSCTIARARSGAHIPSVYVSTRRRHVLRNSSSAVNSPTDRTGTALWLRETKSIFRATRIYSPSNVRPFQRYNNTESQLRAVPEIIRFDCFSARNGRRLHFIAFTRFSAATLCSFLNNWYLGQIIFFTFMHCPFLKFHFFFKFQYNIIIIYYNNI